jgi:hypothetical protein
VKWRPVAAVPRHGLYRPEIFTTCDLLSVTDVRKSVPGPDTT